MPGEQPRLVWITGAGSGIGRALGQEFASRGDRVILSGRTESHLRSLQSTIREKHGKADIVLCDVRQKAAVEKAGHLIIESAGVPDILVNNAGTTVFKKFLDTTVEEFDDILQTNLRGPFLATRAVLPPMIARATGLIMNIVSFAAKTTYTESSVYAASKAGVAALMEGLRAEVRGTGIKIVNVFPGAVLTPIWHPKVQAKHGSKMMTAADVAKTIVDLSCQPASIMVEEIVLRPQHGDINA
jgi:short-subunit dehydrogenase